MSNKESDALKDLKSDKEGFLENQKPSADPKKKPQWKKFYFRLIGGSLYYYKNEKSPKANGVVQLAGVKLEEQQIEKKSAIILSAQGTSFIIGSTDSKLVSDWSSSIKANLSKPASNLELKGEVAKMGIMMKAKKNIAGKAATSSLGKSVMNKVIDAETKKLLACIRNLVTVESGSSALADKLERNAIKIVIKSYFLWENKSVPLEEFQKVEVPLKQALRILLAVYDNISKVEDPAMKTQVLDEKFTVVAVLLDNTKDILTKLVSPHMKPKSIGRINEIFQQIARRDFLLKCFSDDSLHEDVSYTVDFIRSYIRNS